MTNTLENRFAENALSVEQTATVKGGTTFIMTTQGCVIWRPGKPLRPIKKPTFGKGWF